MGDMESVLDRIRKLLRLAGNNSNANEAALAAAKANELMLRYKLETVSLDEGAAEEAVRSHLENEPIFSGRKLVSWKNRLASTLATHNACRLIHWTSRGPMRCYDRIEVRIIGTRSNAQVVGYLYSYISREIERLCKEQLRLRAQAQQIVSFDRGGKSWANDFKHGAVIGVGERLREMKAKVAAEYTGAALMVLDKERDALARFYEHIAGQFTRSSAGSGGARSGSGLEAGRAAGRTISVNKGLGGSQGRRELS